MIDENEFFREATLRLLGHLEIGLQQQPVIAHGDFPQQVGILIKRRHHRFPVEDLTTGCRSGRRGGRRRPSPLHGAWHRDRHPLRRARKRRPGRSSPMAWSTRGPARVMALMLEKGVETAIGTSACGG